MTDWPIHPKWPPPFVINDSRVVHVPPDDLGLWAHLNAIGVTPDRPVAMLDPETLDLTWPGSPYAPRRIELWYSDALLNNTWGEYDDDFVQRLGFKQPGISWRRYRLRFVTHEPPPAISVQHALRVLRDFEYNGAADALESTHLTSALSTVHLRVQPSGSVRIVRHLYRHGASPFTVRPNLMSDTPSTLREVWIERALVGDYWPFPDVALPAGHVCALLALSTLKTVPAPDSLLVLCFALWGTAAVRTREYTCLEQCLRRTNASDVPQTLQRVWEPADGNAAVGRLTYGDSGPELRLSVPTVFKVDFEAP